MEYTLLKDRSVELKQFEELTSATSSGFAKVMSTHFGSVSLFPILPIHRLLRGYRGTNRIKRTSMNSRLDDLNRRIITHIHRRIHRQRHLRQAERAWIRILAWPDNLEDWNHGERHVGWSTVWAVGAESQVHVEEGCGVALEPTGLEGDCSAAYGPFCSVCGCWHAATWERVLANAEVG
jgi:hypothetical protein